jgi:hypothetical protein
MPVDKVIINQASSERYIKGHGTKNRYNRDMFLPGYCKESGV